MAEKKTKLADIKTKPTAVSAYDFINGLTDEQKRKDSLTIIEIMKKVTGEEPVMWGGAIIGFGNTIYKSPKTGRAVEWLKIGFSPRKANLSLYVNIGLKEHAEALEKLGKYKTSVGCLYVNKLEDINLEMLEIIISNSYKRHVSE